MQVQLIRPLLALPFVPTHLDFRGERKSLLELPNKLGRGRHTSTVFDPQRDPPQRRLREIKGLQTAARINCKHGSTVYDFETFDMVKCNFKPPAPAKKGCVNLIQQMESCEMRP